MSALREWQDEADAQRARAEAAEAECARLRAELAASIERGKARWGVAAELADVAAERDALAADNVRLRAIVEGRTVLMSDDVAAHALAHPLPAPGTASNGATCDEPIGLWLCVVDGEGVRVLALARESDDQGPYLMAWSSDYGWCGTGDIRRAWPLDATGRPCAWPVVAPEGG